jgi:hypothetical protein
VLFDPHLPVAVDGHQHERRVLLDVADQQCVAYRRRLGGHHRPAIFQRLLLRCLARTPSASLPIDVPQDRGADLKGHDLLHGEPGGTELLAALEEIWPALTGVRPVGECQERAIQLRKANAEPLLSGRDLRLARAAAQDGPARLCLRDQRGQS